ncbi:MAG: putative porin [Candidatus Acidiferrales bacterium]
MITSLKGKAVAFLVASLCLAAPVLAEEPAATTPPPTPVQLQQQLQQQQARILELERLLKEQGAVLELLRQQLTPRQAPAAPGPASASTSAPAVSTAEPQGQTQELDRISGELDALAERNKELGDKVNSLEKKGNDSEKSLTAKIKGLGNFSFSGDLRLRYEPFRGGTGADRNRGRFRARLDIKNKFNDEWSAGLRISSGDDTDPISTNQTLTSFFERKVFNIDQAYILYTPAWAKPFSLTGGKFGYTWKRTELTLDNDLNPEGLSPVLSFNFKEIPLLTNIKLIGFAMPFFESSGGPDSYAMGGGVESSWKLGSRAKLTATANYVDWFRTDTIRAAQIASPAIISGSSNRNAASASAYASRFGLLDLIGQVDIDTGASKWPLMLLFDYVTNTRACANQSVAAVACNAKDRQGYWAEVSVGQTKERHDIQVGYTLIHIEQEAVLGAFNFSDLRAPSDVVNHRFSFAYQAYKNITLGYTLLVGRLLGSDEPWLKRSQIDLLYKF